MLTLHHLGVSQSDRVVWLMEELGLPYALEWYDRGPDGMMPPEYKALHPAATAPVIEDEGRFLTESAVILEYVCHRHAGGKLTVAPSEPNYFDYLYWMHFNNNVQGLFFSGLALGDREDARIRGFIDRRRDAFMNHLDQRLAESPYPGGPEFTCADIMVVFNLTTLPIFGEAGLGAWKNAAAYVERIKARPAYARAMEIAGPTAKRS